MIVHSFTSAPSVNSPRHGYRLRMSGAVPANCDCSYHSSRNLGSVESDEGSSSVAKEATEE